MTTIDYVLFFAYLIGIIIVGASFYDKDKTSDTFTTGDQKFPGWAVTLSIFATFVSSISYLALPGNAYGGNWNVFVFSLSLPIAAFIALKYFVPLYRRVNSPSAYTYLEERFGLWARVYVSACYLLTQVMRIGTILYLLALTVHTITDWNIPLIILMTGVSVMIYSMLGGIQAVIWTDAIQAVILIGGAVVCIIYLLVNIPGGWNTFIEVGSDDGKFSFGSFGIELNAPTFWVVLIYGLFINLQNYGIDQNYVQRYIASPSDKSAGRSALWGGMLYIPVSLAFLVIGTLLYVFYETGAGELAPDLMAEGQADKVFPYFIVHQLPAGLTGILIASIFAAGMSTVSTSFNSGATVIYTDYYLRFRKKISGKDKSMRVLYLASAALSVAGMLVALAMINVKSALDAWWSLASIFSGGMLGLFLLGAFAPRSNRIGAAAGVIAGLLLILYLNVLPFLTSDGEGAPLHSYLTIVLSTGLIFIVGFFVSVLAGKKNSSTA